MKIKPQIYAQALIESANKNNLKEIAALIWRKIQKNNQSKEIPQIIEALDTQYAKANNLILAKIYSGTELSPVELEELEKKLIKRYGKKVLIKTIIKGNLIGYTIKVNDRIIDLSVNNKINRLKKIIGS